jgi:orotidine-5'-phosphate decarboxylase
LAGLLKTGFRATHGIVPALDPAELDAIKRVIEVTTRIAGVVAYKLGLTATLRLGLPLAVRELRSVTDLPLIYDHQKAGPDVPDMAAKFSRICRESGVDGLILFPTAGPQAVKEFAGGALREGLLPIVGGDLPLPDYNVSGGGYVADDALPRIVAAAAALGVDHFVFPANNPARVGVLGREAEAALGRPPALFMPGVGALGGSIGATFAEAPAGSRLYAVVGRAIYGAVDPGEAARGLAEEALRFA